MSLTIKELLYQLAEETAYSSKGHFKTADWIGVSLAVYIFIPLLTSGLTLFFEFPDFWQRAISFFGFLFSMLALSSALANNRDKADKRIAQHMDLGNKYLELHKEIRILASNIDAVTTEKLSEMQKRVSQLDNQTGHLSVSFLGRLWSWFKINKEMDLEWIYKK